MNLDPKVLREFKDLRASLGFKVRKESRDRREKLVLREKEANPARHSELTRPVLLKISLNMMMRLPISAFSTLIRDVFT